MNFHRPRARRWRAWLFALLAPLWLLAAQAAVADPTVKLRGDLAAHGPITLGDLFENAGPASGVIIGLSAPIGLSAVLDAAAVQRLARSHGLDWDNPKGLARITVLSVAAVDRPGPTVEALSYTRSLMTGEIIQPTDLGYAKFPAFAVPAAAPREAQEIIGKMAARPLRAGAPVSIHDTAAPLVIKKDDTVQVAYNADGVSLQLQGKAVASAAIGDPVSVLNTTSKKIIQAIAVGPDQAVVGPDAERLRAASANPLQFASLR